MSEDPRPAKCSVCGAPCVALAINNAFMCDRHFDAWLKHPLDERSYGQRVSGFITTQKSRGAA